MNVGGYLTVGDEAAVCFCAAEASGCEYPSTTCTPSAAQCGGGCCGLGANCTNLFCGGGCCDCFGLESALMISPFSNSLTDQGINGLSYLEGENDAGHYLVVDYDRLQSQFSPFASFGASSYQFQVTLQESGVISFTYGQTAPVPDAGGPDQGQSGVIGLTGTTTSTSIPMRRTSTPRRGCCVSAAGSGFSFRSCDCDSRTWPANQTMVFGLNPNDAGEPPPPSGSYLVSGPVQLTGVSLDAGSLSFGLQTSLVNVGSAPASGPISYWVYLSPEPLPVELLPACSGLPPCLGTFGPFSESFPLGDGGTEIVPPTTFEVADPPPGGTSYYYAEIWVDPADALGLANPRATLGLSTPLAFGVDLTGVVGAVPSGIGASTQLTVPLTLENLGLLPSGNFGYQVYLTAAAAAIAPTDYVLPPVGPAGASLPPAGSLAQTFTGDLSQHPNGGVPLGDYFVTLSLPTQGDLNPLNNIVSSTRKIHVAPAHLMVTAVQAAATAFIGKPTDVSYTLTNDGAEDAPGGDAWLQHPSPSSIPRPKAATSTGSNEPLMLEPSMGSASPPGAPPRSSGTAPWCRPPPAAARSFPRRSMAVNRWCRRPPRARPSSPGVYLVGVYIADPHRVVRGMATRPSPPRPARPRRRWWRTRPPTSRSSPGT